MSQILNIFISVERETVFLLKAMSKIKVPFSQSGRAWFTGGELSRPPCGLEPDMIPVLGDGLRGRRESFLVELLLSVPC